MQLYKIFKTTHAMIHLCFSSLGAEELPTGWEKQYDAPSGRFYYVDHINLKTQWENPSLGYAPPPAIGKLPDI